MNKDKAVSKSPKISPAPPAAKRPERAPELKRSILAALSGGELTGAELAVACNADSKDRTFIRARVALRDAGEIVTVGISRGARYRLADG